MRTGLLCLLAALAACDLPTAPEASNPYDPAFGGPRIPTAPSDLRLATSSLAEITLAWTDNSTFESGVRVERAPAPLFGDPSFLRFETLAVLPPDATGYTDTDLASDAPVAYRVTAVVEGGRASVPSDVLALRYRTDRVPVDPLANAFGRAEASPDGATVYVQTYQSVSAVDVATGALVARFDGVEGVAGFLADGRVAFYRQTFDGVTLVSLFRGAVRETIVALFAPSCVLGFDARLVVSADGTRAAAVCRGSRQLAVWHIAAPATPTLIGLSPTGIGSDEALAGLSPDGRTVVGGTSAETVAFDTDTRAARWRAPVGAGGARLSPDGRFVLLSGGVGRVNVRDAATGAVRAGADGEPFAFRFSGDGATVSYPVFPSGVTVVQVARTADLAPVARLSEVDPVRVTPTAGGAVALVSGSFPREEIVRWDFSRGWEAFTLAPL